MSPSKLILVLALVLSGCAETRVLMRGTLERESSPWMLRFEGSGRSFVGSQRIFLPTEEEHKHFGITVVDASSLPEEWTQGQSESRVVVVSLIDRSSPLAKVGIRPYDRILEINGEKATLSAFHKHIHTAISVKLKLQRPSGQIKDCLGIRSDNIYQCDSLYLPALFDYQSTSSGQYFGMGLWQTIYHHRSATLIPFPDDEYGEKQSDYRDIKEKMEKLRAIERELVNIQLDRGKEGSLPESDQIIRAKRRLKVARKDIAELEDDAEDLYRKRFEWGALANLVYYQSEVNLQTGRKKRRFRLLWLFSFGSKMTKDL